jgi:hypothetical protein
MAGSSSSSKHCCLVCILFGLCLAFVIILAGVLIYHLNSSNFSSTSKSIYDQNTHSTAAKRQLPDFVNINIDPCEYFYGFVCDKWTRGKHKEKFNNIQDIQQKWTHIQQKIHDKLMTNISHQSITSEGINRSFV